MLRASGVTSDYSYNRVSRVKTITHTSPTAGVLEALSYDYNPSGTVAHMTDHNGLHVFGYDKTYQLTSVDYPDASPFPDITYHYDAAGNRTSTMESSQPIDPTTKSLAVGGCLLNTGEVRRTFLLLAVALFACQRSAPQFPGRIVFSSGSTRLEMIDLTKKSVTVVANLDGFIDSVAPFAQLQVLVSECTATGSCSIEKVSIENGSHQRLLMGRSPAYVVASDTIYYWSSCSDKDSLCLHRLKNASSQMANETRAGESLLRTSPPPHSTMMGLDCVRPLQIAKGILIVRGEQGQLFRVDDAAGSVDPLTLRGIAPIAWDPSSQRILAYRELDQRWVMASLDGTVKESELGSGVAPGVVCVSTSGDMVFSRSRALERWDTILRTADGSEYRLADRLLAAASWLPSSEPENRVRGSAGPS